MANKDFIAANYSEAIECPDEFGIGDAFVDGEFSRVVNIVNDDAETL